jgi:hypothetical protein
VQHKHQAVRLLPLIQQRLLLVVQQVQADQLLLLRQVRLLRRLLHKHLATRSGID